MVTEEQGKAALAWAERMGIISSAIDLVEGEDYEVVE